MRVSGETVRSICSGLSVSRFQKEKKKLDTMGRLKAEFRIRDNSKLTLEKETTKSNVSQ